MSPGEAIGRLEREFIDGSVPLSEWVLDRADAIPALLAVARAAMDVPLIRLDEEEGDFVCCGCSSRSGANVDEDCLPTCYVDALDAALSALADAVGGSK